MFGIIECRKDQSGMYAWENPPRFSVGERTYLENSTNLYASAIAHDACHSEQYQNGKSIYGENAESECIEIQLSCLVEIGGTQAEINTVKESLNRRYWEIPFSERTW